MEFLYAILSIQWVRSSFHLSFQRAVKGSEAVELKCCLTAKVHDLRLEKKLQKQEKRITDIPDIKVSKPWKWKHFIPWSGIYRDT